MVDEVSEMVFYFYFLFLGTRVVCSVRELLAEI